MNVERSELPRNEASLFEAPVVFWCAQRTDRRAKNSQLQFLPRQPALRAHSRKTNSLSAKPVLIKSILVPLQVSRSSAVAPNPSIEGTFKRLRLLPAPHVKR
jgi:hypothetical protein